VLNNPETVLTEHLRIEARLAAGNPPQVIEQAKQTRATFLSFKEWLTKRQQAAAQEHNAESTPESGRNSSGRFPTYREWLAERESRPVEGS
jgi:hypothetical protein